MARSVLYVGRTQRTVSARLRAGLVYWIDGRPFISDWQAKLYGAWRTLLGHGDDAAVVIVYADKPLAGQGDSLLRDFLHSHWPRLDTTLRDVRDGTVTQQQ